MSQHLREQQFILSRHLRDPAAHPPPPGIEERRLALYRDLFFNNIDGLLAGNFPVIRMTLGDQRWHALVRAFYAQHRSRTPLFTEIGQEFVRYLRIRAAEGNTDPQWLPELAHYEWIELALQIADDALPACHPQGDLLDGKPVLSPLMRALAYRWPVHRIGPDFQPDAPPDTPTLLLVRRDAAGDVRFAALSPLMYRLIELLDEPQARSGRQTLQMLAEEAGGGDADFIAHGEAMLERMRSEGSVLGSV